jgi:aminoglycoside phosphotransferase (APT) family kinase protein
MAQGVPDRSGADLTADVFAHVPGCESGEPPLAIARLTGTAAHRSYRLHTRSGEFVVRFTRDRPGVVLDRAREALLQASAADAGLAPRIVWQDRARQILISEYAPGRVWTRREMSDAQQLARLAERLRVLHAIATPDLTPFDAAATARAYRSCIRESHREAARELDRWVIEIEALLPTLASESRALSIVHGDPHHSNVIDSEPLVLIDWEYATLADPLYDLACLLAYYPGARSAAAVLLESAGLAACANEEMLLRTSRMYERLNALWYRAVTATPSYGADGPESSD